MSNIENEIKILLNLFNSAKFDILISKAKKLIKKSSRIFNFVQYSRICLSKYR